MLVNGTWSKLKSQTTHQVVQGAVIWGILGSLVLQWEEVETSSIFIYSQWKGQTIYTFIWDGGVLWHRVWWIWFKSENKPKWFKVATTVTQEIQTSVSSLLNTFTKSQQFPLLLSFSRDATRGAEEISRHDVLEPSPRALFILKSAAMQFLPERSASVLTPCEAEGRVQRGCS